MPTFVFYQGGSIVDTQRGANPQQLEAMVQKHAASAGPAAFSGAGNRAWDGVGMPPSAEAAREARLKALEAMGVPTRGGGSNGASAAAPAAAAAAPPVPPEGTAKMEVDEDEELARAVAMSVEEVGAGVQASEAAALQDAADEAEAKAAVEASMEVWDGEEMVPLPVDEMLLQQLMDMGFSDCRARKGIHHGATLEGAVAWIEENQSDPNIDQPYMVRRKDTVPKKQLTPEEFAAKVEETKQIIAKKREERAEHEKLKAREDEKMRRERGKQMAQTQAEREALSRKREMDKVKREKLEAKNEKARILAQIKADKAIRKANGGKLHSVLGVDGYNPSIVQTGNAKDGADGTDAGAAAPPTAPADAGPPGPRIDAAIKRIMQHRTAGVGGKALKLLVTFVKNIVANPTEAKFRSINAEGKAFKDRIAPVTGATSVLKAVGFAKNDVDKYVLPDDNDAVLLKETLDKLAAAEAEFARLNPA